MPTVGVLDRWAKRTQFLPRKQRIGSLARDDELDSHRHRPSCQTLGLDPQTELSHKRKTRAVKERTHVNIKSLYFHKRHKEEVWLMMAVLYLQKKKQRGGKEREGF